MADDKPKPPISFVDEQGRLQSPLISRPGGEPRSFDLPPAADMLGMSDADLDALARRFGLQRPWTEMQGDAADYVRRMSDRLRGSEAEIAAEVQRITNPIRTDENGDPVLDAAGNPVPNRRAYISAARRATERWSTAEALSIAGDPNHELIRISEGDDSVCDSCASLGGTIGTLSDHEAAGMPGAASCDGGDQCRCSLVLFK